MWSLGGFAMCVRPLPLLGKGGVAATSIMARSDLCGADGVVCSTSEQICEDLEQTTPTAPQPARSAPQGNLAAPSSVNKFPIGPVYNARTICRWQSLENWTMDPWLRTSR